VPANLSASKMPPNSSPYIPITIAAIIHPITIHKELTISSNDPDIPVLTLPTHPVSVIKIKLNPTVGNSKQ